MLELTSVTKKYGKQLILDNVSQVFGQGISLLVGPSGAGKSTLLRLCASAESVTSGQITWSKHPVRSRAFRSNLGYAPQIVDLPDDLNGLEFMRHIAALKGLGRSADHQAREIMTQLGLGASIDLPIGVYSGGMRRRLVFAQSLLGAPKVLALDEPTAELDNETAARVAALISKASQTAIVLVTTHLADHFQAEGATVLRVDGGKVAAQ